MRVEPLDGELRCLRACLLVDTVVSDARNGDELLWALGAIEGLDAVIAVVKQFFLLSDDEEHRTAWCLVGFLGRSIVHEPFADRSTAEAADGDLPRFGIAEFAACSFRRFI